MNIFNEKEFLELCEKLNTRPRVEEVTINYDTGDFFQKMKSSIRNDRRGEVVFCVIRPSGSIITVTCEEYPDGIFRIPTGGLGHNEDILQGVFREVREELGLGVEIVHFGGVSKIKFRYNNEEEMFYSYIFILREKSGKLLADAADDEVSEVKEVDLDGLKTVSLSLKEIEGEWHDWGQFRYVTSNAVYRILKDKAVL